ncbi:jerky-like protein [Lasius niger]|uniref:Jerky-like protein n=1 Tax=Lasius niger TaxID=67767 RepID=A0A0J7JVP4_LASNI|nr:jerky-like protein [Lasius niger]
MIVAKKQEITEYLCADSDPPAINHMSDDKIISSVLNSEINDHSDSETDSDDGVTEKRITMEEGINLGYQYLKFLESQKCVTEQELMTISRLQQKLSKEKANVLKQATIEQMFKKANLANLQ